jgi:hypothetical protein
MSDDIPSGIIQYSWKWGNSEWSPWHDAPGESDPVEMTQGFFLRSRVKPIRCQAGIGVQGLLVECERRAHDDPGDDTVHEGAAYGLPGAPLIRWTDPEKDRLDRMFPTWDGKQPDDVRPKEPQGR